MAVINFPFRRDPIFDTKEIDKAPTSPKYDSMFKSLEALDYDVREGKLVECNTSSSLLPIGNHFESSSSDSLTSSHMIPIVSEPFLHSNHSVKDEPLIDYTLSPWAPPRDNDKSIISHFQCDPHEQHMCVSPSHQSPFPTNHNPVEAIKYDINDKDHHGNNMLEISIHQKFMSLNIDISIFWLEERIL